MVGEYDNSVQSGCANISQYLGSVSDRADARFACATNAPSVVKFRGNSGDPNVRNATFVKGNVTWMALNRVGGSHQPSGEGTDHERDRHRDPDPPADDGSGAMTPVRRAQHRRLRDLLLGAVPPPPRAMSISRSTSATNRPNAEPDPHHRLRQTLHPAGSERLRRMSDNIATRSPQTAADIGFINNTTEPVYKMLWRSPTPCPAPTPPKP